MSRTEFDQNFPYGLDRPRQARGTLSAGMGLGVLALVLALVLGDLGGPNGLLVLVLLIAFVAAFVISAGLFRTSRTTKVQAADRMLDGLDLRGDEWAVDLGCGTGLLCAGLAVRLPEGSVVGVDSWVANDLQPTGRALAKKTLQLAGVKKVSILTGSVRELPLGDASMDLAVSRDVLGSLPGRDARREAVEELARVLVPGGRVALLEPFRSRELAAALTAAGFQDVRRGKRWWILMPPHRLVTATR
jgi:arsenite methyltransferase